jgi:hypothetical protein
LGTNVSKKEGQEMLGKFLFLSTAILALNFGAAKAAPEDVPEHDLDFTLKDGYILAEGGFAEDSAVKFKAFLAENGKAEGTWNIPLYIQSLGGNLGAALDMGYILRDHGMSTVSFNWCASACTYMMMGGVNRVVAKNGVYAVHQFSFDNSIDPQKAVYSNNDLQAFQDQVASLHDYANQMGVDAQVVSIASHTPPSTTTNLTREQLVTLKVDNVPTDQADGQEIASIAIPGVNAPDQRILQELALPDLPRTPTIEPHGLSKIAAQGVVQGIIAAQAADVGSLEKVLSSRYGKYLLANGEVTSGEKLVTKHATFAKDWAYRSRVIDKNSLNTTCQDNDVACTVTGEFDDQYGVTEDGVVVKNRYRFSYTIMLPIALPAVTVEQIEKVN